MNRPTNYALKEVRQSREYTVCGAPDTRGMGQRPATVRPETVTIKFVDGILRWVRVYGLRILRDGSISGYYAVGYGAYPFGVDPLPSWVADILRDEGLTWPGAIDGGQP